MRKKFLLTATLLLSLSLNGCAVSVPQLTKETAENNKTTLVSDKKNRNSKDDKIKKTNNEEVVNEDTNQNDDPFANEKTSERSENVFGSPTNLYLDGYHFTIPSDYYCMYDETIGPIVYLSNVFQMKFGIRETPFNDLLADISNTTSTAKQNGAEVVQEPKQLELNGITYIYYAVKLEDDTLVAVLSDTPDHKGHLGGQFVIESSDVTYEDMVHVYASINETIETTNEKNSTADDISAQQKVISGERKDVSSIKSNGKTINYSVPEGFYTFGGTDDGDAEFYECATYSVTVSMDTESIGDAKYNADISVSMNDDSNPKLETYEVDGKTIYVVTSYYTHNGKTYNSVDCFYDFDSNCIMQVSANNTDGKMPSFEEFKGFFNLR